MSGSSAVTTPTPGRGRVGIFVLGATMLAVLSSLGAQTPPPALALEVRSVPLNPEDPTQMDVGALRFRGGLWLRSADPRFGGLSGLRISGDDGERLVAVSDCGRGLVASLVYDSRGHLADLRDAELMELPGPEGRALAYGEIDAEDLALDAGGLLVAFEGKSPRLWRYGLEPPFGGPPESRPGPPFDEACLGNSGPEALASLPDGRLLVACEGNGVNPLSTTLWVEGEEGWTSRRYPLFTEAGGGGAFRPTAAAPHPGGGVLVLERRYPPLAARLTHLTAADLEGAAALAPRELARLEPPLTLDNLEGLDVRRDATGATLVYVLSDDNGCAKRPGVVAARVQRTLLLLFELLPC